MNLNVFSNDPLAVSLVTLFGIRFFGMLVFLSLYREKKLNKYLLLTSGWLFVCLGSAWSLYTHLSWGAMENHISSMLSALGTFWIGCGILAYFYAQNKPARKLPQRVIAFGSLFIIIYGFLPMIGFNLGPSPGVLIQIAITFVLAMVVIFKRRTFNAFTYNSYYWLVVLVVLSLSLTLAFGAGLIHSDNLALGFSATAIVQFVTLIFLLHIDFSLATQQLQSSEQRFIRLARATQDVVFRYHVSPDGVSFDYVSPTVTDITGYTPQEFYDTPSLWRNLVHPEDRELLDSIEIKDLVQLPLTLRWIKKDGEVIWGEQRLIPVLDSSGKVMAVEGIVRDNTFRKQSEEALENLQNLYQQLFSNINSGVVIYKAVDKGVDFVIEDVNLAAERIEKIPKEEMLGKKVTEIFPGIREMTLLETFKRVWETGVPESHPTTIYSGKSLKSWRENYVYKLPSGNIVAVYDDVTNQIQAAEQLKESEGKYRLLVENQQDLIVKVDPEGHFLYVSPSYCRTFGKSEEELLGKQFIPLVHQEDIETTLRGMQALNVPPHTCYIEQRAMTKDGWRWLAWTDTAIVDENGTVKEILGLGIDITDKKKAESELRKLKDDLEKQVSEKTSELQTRITELEKFHDATIEREFRMKALRDEIKDLKTDEH